MLFCGAWAEVKFVAARVNRDQLDQPSSYQVEYDLLTYMVQISVSDPYHFDADRDPDSRIRFRDDESGSGSGSGPKIEQIPIFSFLIFSV